MSNLILGFLLGVPVGAAVMVALVAMYLRSESGNKVIADMIIKIYEMRIGALYYSSSIAQV
jgi:hypothetical protein